MQTMSCNSILAIIFFMGTVSLYTSNASCKMGEPKPGDLEPDLNMTVSPSNVVRLGEKINITCIAGKPRFPIDINIRPRDVTSVKIEIGDEEKICTLQNNQVIINCTYTTILNTTTKNMAICTAKIDGDCRYKITNITFTKKSSRSLIASTSIPGMIQTSTSKGSLATSTSMPGMIQTSTSKVDFTPTTTLPSGTIEISTLQETLSSTMVKYSTTSQMSTIRGQTRNVEFSSKDDDKELDTVKSIVVATLVLVVIMMVCFMIAVLYIIHNHTVNN